MKKSLIQQLSIIYNIYKSKDETNKLLNRYNDLLK